jgi:UDP-glucose 4-epimerase
MNILVVGANGFLGSLITDHFSKDSRNTVFAFDRYARKTNLPTRSNLIQIAGEVSEISKSLNVIKSIDIAFHCFSSTRPGTDFGRETEIEKYETIPSQILFEFCSTINASKVIYLSSGGAVYGDRESYLNTEESVPTPTSPYGMSKLKVERSLLESSRVYGFKPLILRLSNPYGPHQRVFNQGFINTTLRNVLEGRVQPIYGDGSMVRDYIYTSDLLNVITDLALGTPIHEIYNVGSGIGHSINEVIHIIESEISRDVKTINVESPANLVLISKLNIDRFTQEFGKQETLSVREGIRKMIHEYGIK